MAIEWLADTTHLLILNNNNLKGKHNMLELWITSWMLLSLSGYTLYGH